jgi:hypothetical protein
MNICGWARKAGTQNMWNAWVRRRGRAVMHYQQPKNFPLTRGFVSSALRTLQKLAEFAAGLGDHQKPKLSAINKVLDKLAEYDTKLTNLSTKFNVRFTCFSYVDRFSPCLCCPM